MAFKFPSIDLPSGTVLYHGTDRQYEMLHNEPTFFVLSESEALRWAGWSDDSAPLQRVLKFEVVTPAFLLHIPDEQTEEQLSQYLGVEHFSGDTRAFHVCNRLNYDGYLFGDPLKPDEIVLCQPQRHLNFLDDTIYSLPAENAVWEDFRAQLKQGRAKVEIAPQEGVEYLQTYIDQILDAVADITGYPGIRDAFVTDWSSVSDFLELGSTDEDDAKIERELTESLGVHLKVTDRLVDIARRMAHGQ